MINLKGYEYELVIQALELPGNNADELFKALIKIAKEFDALPYATEYIKNWNILFNDLPFIANYVENNGHSLKEIINEYEVTFFSNLENALAEVFVETVLYSILQQLNNEDKK